MTKIKALGKLTGGYGVMMNTCWDSGYMFPIATLQIIKEFGV